MRRLGGLVLFIGLLATRCDAKECTLIGCGAEFRVDFQRAAWTAGDYTVEIVADGETRECTATLPLDCAAPPACANVSELLLLLDGCALDPAEHRIAGVEFQEGSAPASVEVRVLQDGVLLAGGVYEPSYSESFPNGPECGPGCLSAEPATLALP